MNPVEAKSRCWGTTIAISEILRLTHELGLSLGTDDKLGLEKVDLYLIHWPLTLIQEDFNVPIPKECIVAINIKDVEMNPLWQQKKLNDFCKKDDILLTGYSPLGASGTHWGHKRVMECDVALRWIYEQGVSFVVKSFNKQRMQQNLDIFDWSLTEDELNKINQIPQQKHVYLTGLVEEETKQGGKLKKEKECVRD
ncbi:NADPH-dependent codeinone reductase 1-4 [Artemisia annua]|uniref:NADPH-dependent codeinone reductase 1-4 n=1 Tax=Artemisia annua TaxID=35608 RepID=A0A2U1MJ42_ARTAN|nr:NADPH-dependent codeinone reductase 1-4 [Artemisia annua]